MSRETLQWLNTNTLIGFTDKRGNAWHYRAEDQGKRSNHYPGAIPVKDVEKRLFTFDVEATPLYIPGANGEFVPVPNRMAQVRKDTGDVFGIFTDGFQGHDYTEWLIRNLSNLISDTLAIGSAGLLNRGAQAWVQIEMPENVDTPEGMSFRPNLLATTSFDGTLATTYKRCCQIVVCDNTKDAALAEDGQQAKFRHSRHSAAKILDARAAIGVVETMADDFAAEIKRLGSVKVTDKEWNLFLDGLVPMPEETNKRGVTVAEAKRDTLNLLWTKDERVSPWTGTALGVSQAVNTFNLHETRVNKSKNGEATRAERNMTKILNGSVGKADAAAMVMLGSVLTDAKRERLSLV